MHALTSWKEIAAHLGKSIRTVQRWERELGLPVRRPGLRRSGIVFGDPKEMDIWFHAQTTLNHGPFPPNGIGNSRSPRMDLTASREMLQCLAANMVQLCLRRAQLQLICQRHAQVEWYFRRELSRVRGYFSLPMKRPKGFPNNVSVLSQGRVKLALCTRCGESLGTASLATLRMAAKVHVCDEKDRREQTRNFLASKTDDGR